MYQWILEKIKHKLDKYQFGAISGSSTVHALVKLLHNWYGATDNNLDQNIIRILLVDYTIKRLIG